jgi:hypothetical protein
MLDRLVRSQVVGLTDETTIGQLAGLLYELDSQGRTKIESKEKARKRGVPSPDRADALMLALSQPYQKFECYTIRDLPRLRSGAKPSADYDWSYAARGFGFRDLGDDDGDDKRDPWAGWCGKLRLPRGRVSR